MPQRRPRNLRSSRHSADPWGDSAEHQPSADPRPPAVDVVDLLEFRRASSRRQCGIGVEGLAKGEHKGKPATKKHTSECDVAAAAAADNNNNNNGHHSAGSEKAGKPTMARSLEGAFTAQTNRLDANKHMMAYIESEMRRRRHADGGDDGGDDRENAADAAPKTADADLYQVPQHLRVIDERPVSEGNVAMAARMLTSIQEVDLGAESKARNARATERALSQQQQQQPDAGSTPGHPHDDARQHTEPTGRPARARATDDAALQRFKKRMRR